MGLISRVSSRTYRNWRRLTVMLSRALRFGLGRTTTSVRTYAAAGRLDDWENFKMPGAPYADMGPLPPAPAKLDDAGKTRMTYISESYFKLLEGKLGYTGPYTLLFGGLRGRLLLLRLQRWRRRLHGPRGYRLLRSPRAARLLVEGVQSRPRQLRD